ncbi:DUF397 domain-containing protein [Saccharopolyspora hattusasensis]|uniref:DUF397 domain-containing protein n=1 Tax=Saccharopolyspora hattusasensis TaxID=1128679 RepID=UPI003D970B06
MLPAQTRWRKSSYSNGGGNCVEVAAGGECTGVRDTKDRAGGVLIVPARQWGTFIAAAKSGRYHR